MDLVRQQLGGDTVIRKSNLRAPACSDPAGSATCSAESGAVLGRAATKETERPDCITGGTGPTAVNSSSLHEPMKRELRVLRGEQAVRADETRGGRIAALEEDIERYKRKRGL